MGGKHPLDMRHTIGDSGWHGADGTWGTGIQWDVIDDVGKLAEQLKRDSGIAGLEIVDPSTPDFAERASDLLRRDGFVCVKDVGATALPLPPSPFSTADPAPLRRSCRTSCCSGCAR